jgi:hypothetical protein
MHAVRRLSVRGGLLPLSCHRGGATVLGRAEPFLGSPVAKHVRTGWSKSVNSEHRHLHDTCMD